MEKGRKRGALQTGEYYGVKKLTVKLNWSMKNEATHLEN